MDNLDKYHHCKITDDKIYINFEKIFKYDISLGEHVMIFKLHEPFSIKYIFDGIMIRHEAEKVVNQAIEEMAKTWPVEGHEITYTQDRYDTFISEIMHLVEIRDKNN